jgi:hypothetical protein
MGVSKTMMDRSATSSPRSVLDFPLRDDDDAVVKDITRSSSREKRRLDFEPITSMNFRHRLVCNKTVEWLANGGDEECSQVEKLFLGPVFESSQTVLSAISTLPPSVTHLDLDLRNALDLVPQAMPLLFSKHHIDTLSVRIFGDSGAVELAKWIHQNPQLKRLDLRGNRIGLRGAQAVFDALVRCDHPLISLNLSCNCIVNGAVVSNFLRHNRHLETLDLSYNWIGDAELSQICQSLQTNTSLRELNVFGCQRISAEGLKVLLACLTRYNTSLTNVKVHVFDSQATEVRTEIDHLLSLNRAGRGLLKEDEHIPRGL